MDIEEFNYWERINYYQEKGCSKEESEDMAFKDLMVEFKKICKIIDNK